MTVLLSFEEKQMTLARAHYRDTVPLRQAKNIDSSKHLLKTYLFSLAFCQILGTFYFIFIFCF